ncbi:amidohydrolase family protein [Wenzhouxiangella sp. AB-CW3]|uniref:amidohydrolase family protein n=1 Tax=Wenzhouxiangella sp. AB-CW3 TaxID=2771012 RepID=UPI00168B45C9|nr:amidohydrolase family protein [Wenzhouxiangella sp. AB-CW3]QOC22404.1 amidohydrolase family protein [Wenzhouxiangella sp. AB-CW3]
MTRLMRTGLAGRLGVAAFLGIALAVGSPVPASDRAVVFGEVAIVDTRDGQVLEGQTVVVVDGMIDQAAATDEVEIPADAKVIDGSGHYLMPGLAEMHGHLPFAGPDEALVGDLLFLYVANGVTLVRGMQGHEEQLRVRQAIDDGQLLGPRLVLGSPAMGWGNTPEVDEAPGLIEEFAGVGFDLVKIGEGPDPETFEALRQAAEAHGLPLAGHVPDEVGLEAAMAAGMVTIDHLDNYVEELVPEDQRADIAPLWGVASVANQAQLQRLDDLVELTARYGTAQVPTMVLWETFFGGEKPGKIRRDTPEARYVPTEMVDNWEASLASLRETIGHPAGARQVVTLRRLAFQRLHQAGVPFLLGTDSPQLFSVPGFSTHREMALWVALGMTPAEVIHAGTWAVAEHFDELDRAGSVAEGKRADLILTSANPLDDVGAIAEARAGVMVAGQWLPESAIRQRLDDMADSRRDSEQP